MVDEGRLIDAIVAIMRSRWDLPADCNEGELLAYAEHLLNRIRAGDSTTALYGWLGAVQTEKLDIPPSHACKEIVDRAAAHEHLATLIEADAPPERRALGMDLERLRLVGEDAAGEVSAVPD